MEIEVTPLDEQCNVVRLHGRLDTTTIDRMETRFTAAVVAANRNAVIDLSDVSFLASMAIRMLITNARAMTGRGRKLALFGANENVMSVLEAVSLDQIIPITGDQQQAVAALAG